MGSPTISIASSVPSRDFIPPSMRVSTVGQPPSHLAPVLAETVQKGPKHRGLMKFVATMKGAERPQPANRTELVKLIGEVRQEAESLGMPGARELVAADILEVRYAVTKTTLTGREQYDVQKAALYASSKILETPKAGLKGLLQRRTSPDPTSRSDKVKENLKKALLSMVGTSVDWAEPIGARGPTGDEKRKKFGRVEGDIKRIARTATECLDPKQQSEVFARMVSVAHKSGSPINSMLAARSWLRNNIAETKIVLMECVKQVMCGEWQMELLAYKLLETHMGHLARDDLKELYAQFEKAISKEWTPKNIAPAYMHVPPPPEPGSNAYEGRLEEHKKRVEELQNLFALHLPNA